MVHANSVRVKQTEIETLIFNVKPDAIIVTDTKLGKKHDTSNFLHNNLRYRVYRNDKRSDCGEVF